MTDTNIPIDAPVRTNNPEVTSESRVAPATPPPIASTSAATPPVGDTTSRGPGPVMIGDADEIPGDAELLTLSRAALKSRLQRATRSELKERFGTDDPEDIKQKLDLLATYEAEKEETRLANLSELEREREMRARAEGERDEWKRQHGELRDSYLVRKEHSRIESIASKHVDPTMQDYALGQFQRYLTSSLSDEQIENLTDPEIEQWFTQKVREIPKLARDFQAAPPPPPAIVPLSNGPQAGNQPAPPQGVQPTKSFSPSAANAMTRQEAIAEARKQGYSF